MSARARCLVACALVLAATRTTPAFAADDGGTRSVFAYGAGNRALAMGSAFVACPDDASALVWNPGGLALQQRAQFEGSQSGDLGLGARDVYAALVAPSWRWGTVGVALRHFGVDGIEQRDDRNVLLSNNLTDSESEIALGYGRAFGNAWGLGGTVKLQNQSLAGYSGSGIGVDLGLTVRPAAAFGLQSPWAQRWSLGIAVRNAVEPAVRLDVESVPDPATLRAGVAYRMPLASGWMLAEGDVEHTRNMSPRLHAGLELQPIAPAALRAGFDAGHLTAGVGLRWHDLSADYAFEDNPLGASQRAGITLHFGATVEESRTAARRAEDEAIQRRLADGFQKRQAEQVAALVEQAQTARREMRFDDALEAVGFALALDPAAEGAKRLERECLLAKAGSLEHAGDLTAATVAYDLVLKGAAGDSAATAGAARCRSESDRRSRRSAALRERFAQAMDAFAAGNLPAARTGFAAVLAADSADVDAREMQARTQQAISRQASAMVEQAARFVRAGLAGDAQTLLDQAAALDPATPALVATRDELQRLRRASAAPVPPVAVRGSQVASPRAAQSPAGRALSDQELAALYRHGTDAAKSQRADEALRYFELVWASRPDYRGVAEYLKREYLTRGMDAFAAGRLDEAIGQWEKVLKVDPNDTRARGYLARAQQQAARSREILGANR